MKRARCHGCRSILAPYDTIHFGSIETGYRDLCNRCFNEEVARMNGLDFQHVSFEPTDLIDASGARHRFYFQLRLLGDRVSLNAFEVKDGDAAGYAFQAIDEVDVDLFELMARLVERINRTLALRHLEEDAGELRIADMTIRAQVSSDRDYDARVPLLVIDGREVTWRQFGEMLMMFEGWQFKLEIKDRSEEL